MDGLLDSSQAAQLAMLMAVTSDEENKRRIADLLKAQKDAEAALEQVRAERQAIQSDRLEAEALHRAASDKEAGIAARHAELDERERQLGDVNNGISAEKAAFEDVRKTATAELTAARDTMRAREMAVQQRENEVARRMAEVTQRESEVSALHASLSAKHERLKQALADNEA